MTDYLMEDPREAGRLTQKVDSANWVERYYAPYLPNAINILDVGCGPGVLAAEIARGHSGKSIVGVDLSEARIEYARKHHKFPNLSFECADSTDLPFSTNSFELVYSRLMLEYLKDPLAAIREMVRVCKPGGNVILQDLDGQLAWHFPPPSFEKELQTVLEAFSETGHDVLVGRKLYYFAKAAGLGNLSVKVDSYHLYAGRIPDKELKEWELKLEIALPKVESVLGKEKALELKQEFLSYLVNENTLTYSVLFTVAGEVA